MHDLLFYGGLALAGASAVAAIVTALALWASRKRLERQLDSEYGRKK